MPANSARKPSATPYWPFRPALRAPLNCDEEYPNEIPACRANAASASFNGPGAIAYTRADSDCATVAGAAWA
ncbi:hypothetical protein ADE_30600 [Achromobacter denitrificans]|nr:hypothetical protein ADE_30600 [Achromobacter denitrificans]